MSPSSIEEVGQTGKQSPQAVHSSVIVIAISISSKKTGCCQSHSGRHHIYAVSLSTQAIFEDLQYNPIIKTGFTRK
jgi:hypothetical protein